MSSLIKWIAYSQNSVYIPVCHSLFTLGRKRMEDEGEGRPRLVLSHLLSLGRFRLSGGLEAVLPPYWHNAHRL